MNSMATAAVAATGFGATPEEWAHFQALGLTADLLPVVSNLQATISPTSKMRDLGKTPSKYNGARQVVGFHEWTQHQSTQAQLQRWAQEADYGIALQTRTVRALDVDIADEDLARKVRAVIESHAQLPVRFRANSAKFLCLFTMPGEFAKRKVIAPQGAIEFLASGQQCLVAGTHPSGARYEFEGGLPSAFPVLTSEAFEALWTALGQFGEASVAKTSLRVKGEHLDITDPAEGYLWDNEWALERRADGAIAVVCPWEQEHSMGERGDGRTLYFPAGTNGHGHGGFKCLHAHCESRTVLDFYDAVEYVLPPEDLSAEFTPILDAANDPAQPAPNPKRFGSTSIDELMAEPELTWLIEGVLPQAEVGVLFGQPRAGKSFLVLDMMLAIARGVPWRGFPVQQCRVAYVIAEGTRGLKLRLRAYEHTHGVQIGRLPIAVHKQTTPNFLLPKDAEDLAAAINEEGGAGLIVVDTLAQTTPGADENSSKDMGRALANCKKLAALTGALVLAVHHSGKDATRGARGWSGLKGNVDAEFEVTRSESEPSTASLYVSKLKDAEDGQEYRFKLRTVVYGLGPDGKEQSSMVVEHVDTTHGSLRGAKNAKMGSWQRAAYNAAVSLLQVDDGARMTEVVELAVQEVEPVERGRDRRREYLGRALEDLVERGLLRKTADGMAVRLPQDAAFAAS